MTHRPIGSVWKWDNGGLWRVVENVEKSSNRCILIPEFVLIGSSVTKYIGKLVQMGIDDFNPDWSLHSMPSQQPFTDEEYEELLV